MLVEEFNPRIIEEKFIKQDNHIYEKSYAYITT